MIIIYIGIFMLQARKEKRFVCKFCHERFTEATNRNRHVRNIHRNLVRRFQCQLCFKRLSTADSLKTHSESKHGGWILRREIFDTPSRRIEHEHKECDETLLSLQIEIAS